MKIISLRFANLNSLPGPYLIRFDAAPLADTGLFAITGPTGAGKSTLLDAIAVGLYGRVPRHDRQVGEMVSRHASFAWSEVEFEVHETNADTGQTSRVRYRSRWEVTRKKQGKDKGNLNQDAMSLALSASDKNFLSGKEAVPARVGELSGLDFGQFEQAVLLSQGKFARFLHAPEKERSALLEKMTNVGIYSQLSVAAFEKAKAEKQQTELLAARLEATRLLTEDERAALEQLLDELHAEAELTYEHQQNLSTCLAWRTVLDQLDRQLAEAACELAALQATAEQLRPDLARLAGHERAATLVVPLSLEAAARRELAQDTAALTALSQELPALTSAAEAATLARAAAAQAHTHAEAEVARLRPVLLEAQRQDAHLAAAQHQLTEKQAAHVSSAQLLAADQAAWQQLGAELTDLDRQQQTLADWLLTHNHEADLDKALIEINRDLHDLTDASKSLLRLETEQEHLLRQLAAATAERDRHQQAADQATRHQQELLEQGHPTRTAYAELLGEAQPADLMAAAATLAARLHLGQRLLPLTQTARQQADRAAALLTEHTAEEAALQPVVATLAQLEKDRDQAQLLLASYEHARRLQQALADLNAHRHQLRPGEACPLCGALEHAYPADYQADADEQEQRVRQQKHALGELEKTLRQADLALVRRRTEQQQRQARQQEAAHAAAAARHQAAELAAGHSPALPLEAEVLQQAVAETATAHAAAAGVCARLAELEQQLQVLRTQHDQAKEVAQAATQQVTAAEHRWQLSQQELARLKNDLAEHRAAAADYHAVVQANLVPHQLSLPAAAPYDGVLATLAERAATFGQQRQALELVHKAQASQQVAHITRADELRKREQELRAAAAALATELAALEASRVTRRAHYAGPDPAAEEQALHRAAQQLAQAAQQAQEAQARQQQRLSSHHERTTQRQADLARHQADLDARQAELTAALTVAGFATPAETQAVLLPPAEAARLAARQQRHATSQQAAEQLHAKLTAALIYHHELALTPLSTAALQAELTQLNAENEKLHQRLGAAGSQLSQDDAARQHLAEGLRELQARQQEEQRWQDLAEQIGSAKGDKFSQFAQGLTLSHLARLANLRLRQLTGRYSILKTPNRNLELQIIDHDQADTVRPMASLSGGESFLVSLALALGLSELAGYKARIESLFIDEGFGTLDPDSLNTALDALERLQHSGKMIGIISHVAGLKERIGTQIRVQPVAGGNSTVRVVDVMGTETECCE